MPQEREANEMLHRLNRSAQRSSLRGGLKLGKLRPAAERVDVLAHSAGPFH